jgi:uncharacterized membrane protein
VILSHNRLTRGQALYRVGLIGAGGLLLHTSFTVFSYGTFAEYPLTVLLLMLPALLGFGLIAAGALDKIRLPRWTILAAFLINALVFGIIWAQTLGVTRMGRPMIALTQTDSTIYTEAAAGLLLAGRNPYDWDYSAAMSSFRLSDVTSTPTLYGSQESAYPYPPLTIVLAAPFIAAGLPGIFCVLMLCYAGLIVVTYAAAPRWIAPVILLPLGIGFANDLPIFALIGVTDMVWVMLFAGMAALWDKRIGWAAVLFGLACAGKQSPWLITPFLVLRLYLEQPDARRGILSVLRFGLISGSVFLAINLPFIVMSPGLWLAGVLEPLIDTLIFYGQNSPVNLTQYGYLYLPKAWFLVASLTVLMVTCAVYWRHFPALRHTVWLLPGLYMWFSYRTLTTYWTFWVFPALVVACRAQFSIPSVSILPVRRSLRLTGAVAALGVIVLIGSGAALATTPPLKLQIQSPVIVGGGGRISQITLDVENTGTRPITPRFGIHQIAFSANPMIWQVIEGLPQVAPGTRGRYRIAPRSESNSFYGHDVVQIIVSDTTDYTLRAAATMGERSLLWPDAIPNANFTLWNVYGYSPILWDAVVESAGRAQMIPKNGRDAVVLTIVPEFTIQDKPDVDRPERTGERYYGIEARMPFPMQAFTLPWLTDPDQPAGARATLEIDDGTNIKIIDLAPTNGAWQTIEISLPAIYRAEGWELPPLKRAVYRGLELPWRLVTLRLLLTVDADTPGPVQAYFGGITQGDYQFAPQTFMAETLADPRRYYVRLGDELFGDGIFRRAATAYQRALDYPATSDEIADNIVIERRDRALQLSETP